MEEIRVHRRYDCRLCLSDKVELVIPFSPIYIAEKYLTVIPDEPTAPVPVDLHMCLECGHVQILDVIDPSYLWSAYTYHSGQTQGIVDHFARESRDIIARFPKLDRKFAIDVGSNDGTLLRNFKNAGFKVLGVDPAKEIALRATASGIPTIPQLLTKSVAEQISQQYGKASIITAFNVFAHADDMLALGHSISHMLDDKGIFVFEVSYLLDIVEKMLVGAIFHEHLCNHSLAPIMKFLSVLGLELFDVKRVSIQGGSIIGYAQHKGGGLPITDNVAELLAIEEKAGLHTVSRMQAFNQRLTVMQQEVSEIIAEVKNENGVIAGYGAARSGPMLISQFGLKDTLSYVFDDHPQKVGLFTPGDYLVVLPTTAIEERQPHLVVILAWIHAKKIIQKHHEYLKNGGKFLVLCPDVQVVTYDQLQHFT